MDGTGEPLLGLSDMAPLATGRKISLFAADMEVRGAELQEQVAGRRVLVVGGAGSIGSAVVAELARRRPAALHVVDHNENGLAELVRSLRSAPENLPVEDFRTLPLDYGAAVMPLFLHAEPVYDLVFNFAALKHVRSEKDPWSLLQMLDTNVLKLLRFIDWLGRRGFSGRLFCVSTDKAANPVSLMGASKRLMEHVLFSACGSGCAGARGHSARFANVAFSDGSLLHSWQQRLGKRQPLAAPRDTCRYFVSLEEAAHICVLAALCAPAQAVVVPRLDPAHDLVRLEDIAARVLQHAGLVPVLYDDAVRARTAVASELARGRYPLLLTPLDTSGEKPFEEFVGEGEVVEPIGLEALAMVRGQPLPAGTLAPFLATCEALLEGRQAVSKRVLVDALAAVIPQLHHRETGQNLDQRM